MLKLNLSRLTKWEITDVVAFYFAELGFVNSVVIPETTLPRTFALVSMASVDEMEAVANMFGDGRFGERVIIRLEQDEHFIPKSLLRNAANVD